MMSERTIFFTGFPGFIGSRLLRRLLEDDPSFKVVALVEPTMAERAKAVARSISDRIAIEPGDITNPRLGLTDSRYRELAQRVSHVMHLAAIYNLAVPESVARAVNINGTHHIADFCKASTRLERFHYVSTAYVAGAREGRVLESELENGQGFKNHYESTKHAAEVIVRANMQAIPTTIYRPGIVVGDSRTGETQKFDGPYYMLRFIAFMARYHLPLPNIASDDATFNAVPVDFIVDALTAGVRDSRMIGETLHLVDPSPVTAAELLRLLSKSYAGKRLYFRVPHVVAESMLSSAFMRKVLVDTPKESLEYLNHPVTFDTTRATALLGEHGVRCPRFPDYVDNMVAFFRAHEHDAGFAPPKA